jgi:hypothetical protein
MSFNKGRAAREAVDARERAEQESRMSADTATVNERLLTMLEQTVANQAVQTERTAPRENPNYKVDSPTIKPNGEQWSADLTREVYFGSIAYHKTPLTSDEVAALNLLQPLDRGFVTKTDRTAVPVSVKAKLAATGRIERITVLPEANGDKSMSLTMPSIVDWAMQLAKQAGAIEA